MANTYYRSFPKFPRLASNLTNVFWVISQDARALSPRETSNVVYAGKRAKLIECAPRDHKMVQLNLRGDVSKCRFILTKEGQDYYNNFVLPNIRAWETEHGASFVSDVPRTSSSRGKKVAAVALQGAG